METSRRSFLKGAVGTAAVAAAATLSIPAEAAKAPKKWDVTTDVVVIGFGGAGATTAISAAQNGANVVVLEKNPENHHISNTRMSGGIFHCPDKDGDKAALKAYAKAMLRVRKILWVTLR